MYEDYTPYTCLRSNIEVEYYKVARYYSSRNEYRFDPLTGIIYSPSECTSGISATTYYICGSEYPIYDILGKYLGYYFDYKLYKPSSRHDFIANGTRELLDIWDTV